MARDWGSIRLPVSKEEALFEEQKAREHQQRMAAMGRRVASAQAGHLGPVVKRWINADIKPIADNLRRVAGLYLEGDMEGVALALGSPTTALSQKERPLRPLMEWCLLGSSPQKGADTTFAEDLALAFMGALVPKLAAKSEEGVTLSSALSSAADALRETVQGQFIVSIQGASAMQAIRVKKPELWQQKKSLQRIAMQLQAQVKPELLREEDSPNVVIAGNRRIVSVTDFKGEVRRLELKRPPEVLDWEILSLCWQDPDDGGSHPHRSVWLSFAAAMLSLAQQSGGWFVVADRFKMSRGRKRKTKMLVLSEDAYLAIKREVERWVSNGFMAEPMLVPPEDGDWLTVKHRKVTGQRPPKGLRTEPAGTTAWEDGALFLANTPWTVNEAALSRLDRWEAEDADPAEVLKAAAHKRLAGKEFYLPVNMDFRGRMYYRTPWVTPQTDDFGKSLLCFPDCRGDAYLVEVWTAYHMAGLYGHGLDKAPLRDRVAWWREADRTGADTIAGAEEPQQYAACAKLYSTCQANRIPVQLDGTCNGLQHLSALMRDEVGASAVNLIDGPLPADIYGEVAKKVLEVEISEAPEHGFMRRLQAAGVVIDRSICKGPVMVLPYGGTLEAIRQGVKSAVLKQLGVAEGEQVATSPWHRYEADGYGAFKHRALADHPLFNQDVMALATLIHSCIAPVIPKAMATMDTLQKIGSFVGGKGLLWATGLRDGKQLWVAQAKAVSARKQVTMKGYHLPDVIRRLTLNTQTNEVDPRAHRTGIVANFIHSLDAAHMALTMKRFKEAGGSGAGAIHDCVLVRPSEVPIMQYSLRKAFAELYEEDPLLNPVRLIDVDTRKETCYMDWYELATDAGTEFPEKGTWEVSSITKSTWFFS